MTHIYVFVTKVKTAMTSISISIKKVEANEISNRLTLSEVDLLFSPHCSDILCFSFIVHFAFDFNMHFQITHG